MDKKLYLGVARKDITPEIGCNLYGYQPDVYSESIHDNLTVTAYVFKFGEVSAVMISVTVGSVKTELSDEIRKEISKMYDIPFENIILSATHTHSAPNLTGNFGWGDVDHKYYDGIFLPQLRTAVSEAFASTVKVQMGTAYGDSFVGINRRELTPNNTVTFGQQPWGCFNPRMSILSFKDEAGNVIANIIHYGAHGTAAGMNHEITRDWSGIMTDAVEEVSGGITAFFNGFEGDVGPRLSNGKTTGNICFVEELGAIAAKDAVGIYNKISDYSDCELKCASGVVRIPYKSRIPLEEAKKRLEQYPGNQINSSGQRQRYYENVIKSYENGYEEKEYYELTQSVIQVGGTVFVPFPYEAFSEMGLRIQKEVRDKNVLTLALSNGTGGYFPTQDQLCKGGYEITMFKTTNIQNYVDDADWYLIKETVNNIKKLE